jgi:hypothetical protein
VTWGLTSRRTFVIDTGIVLLGLSLVTLRHYVHLAPLWVVLSVFGAALVVVALAIERALRRAPRGEISGFTPDPLFSDERRQQALQIFPVVATFTAPAAGRPAEDKGFAGGGGRFGGGSASEKFWVRSHARVRVRNQLGTTSASEPRSRDGRSRVRPLNRTRRPAADVWRAGSIRTGTANVAPCCCSTS